MTFWIDPGRDVEIGYDELAAELSDRDVRHPVVCEDDPAAALTEVLLGLLGGEDVVLLDSSFSAETLTELGYDPETHQRTEPAPDLDLADGEAVAAAVRDADPEWTLGLYTSGTTGTPSRVDQTFAGLTRGLRTGERFRGNVWAFAYEPTHVAGMQVFFQAVANQNPMVYVFESDPETIGRELDAHGVTHVSATPTFYRLRLATLPGPHPSVRRLTSGGEPFEPSLHDALTAAFPNASVRNVYALTETGSLLESDGEAFRLPDGPDPDVRVADDGELLVHASLVAGGDLEADGDWYHTGDLVERIDDERVRFVGRRSDVVNVAGYRVSPLEVERLIEKTPGVAAASVSARESSVTGHILVASVTPGDGADPAAVKSAVEETVADLPNWKRPRLVDVVEELPRSRSGKRIR